MSVSVKLCLFIARSVVVRASSRRIASGVDELNAKLRFSICASSLHFHFRIDYVCPQSIACPRFHSSAILWRNLRGQLFLCIAYNAFVRSILECGPMISRRIVLRRTFGEQIGSGMDFSASSWVYPKNRPPFW